MIKFKKSKQSSNIYVKKMRFTSPCYIEYESKALEQLSSVVNIIENNKSEKYSDIITYKNICPIIIYTNCRYEIHYKVHLLIERTYFLDKYKKFDIVNFILDNKLSYVNINWKKDIVYEFGSSCG